MQEKLFMIEWKWEHPMINTGGDLYTHKSREFAVGGSATQVIDAAFSAKQQKFEEWAAKAKKNWESGNRIVIPPSPKPINKGEWSATEVSVPGYTIVLEKQRETSSAAGS